MSSLPRLRPPRWFLPFLIGPVVMGVISVLAWAILDGGVGRGPQRIEYVIPDGTAKRVAAGEDVPSIPAKAVFVVGDVLVLRNQDSVSHQMGPFWIPPGTSISMRLDRASTYNYVCTLHPNGSFGLEVRPRNSLTLALIPTLVLGLPLGAVMSVISRVVGRLQV